MITSNQLTVCDVAIKQDTEGRYCLNNFHKAAGGEHRHLPNYFFETQQTRELVDALEKTTGNPVIKRPGRNGGAFREDGYFNMTKAAQRGLFHAQRKEAMTNLIVKPVTMSSREIADLTGKQHFNVMRGIRKMLEELGFNAINLEGVYLDAKGESRPCFNLPRREVEILLTGYSIPLRAKVIDRLHELEEEAKGRAVFRVPQSLPEALRLAAELAEKNEKLALENKEMALKAVVFDNCVALRQESLATFVRSFEGLTKVIKQLRSPQGAAQQPLRCSDTAPALGPSCTEGWSRNRR